MQVILYWWCCQRYLSLDKFPEHRTFPSKQFSYYLLTCWISVANFNKFDLPQTLYQLNPPMISIFLSVSICMLSICGLIILFQFALCTVAIYPLASYVWSIFKFLSAVYFCKPWKFITTDSKSLTSNSCHKCHINAIELSYVC